jgi:phenylalanyl-tRNA synthetase beta chain
MAELGGGRLISGLIDAYPNRQRVKSLKLSTKNTNRLLGTHLQPKEIAKLLKSIEFTVEPKAPKKDDTVLKVTPPSFRVDISRPEDLMEEVARLSGYNNIPTTFPLMPATGRSAHKEIDLRHRMRQLMIGFGFRETVNYSFMHRQSADRLRLKPDDPRRKLVDILNPLTEDQAVMRTSLVPGLLQTVHFNFFQQTKNLKIFEIGKIFINEDPRQLPREPQILAAIWTGSRYEASWHDQVTDCDFYDIKGVVEALLKALQIDGIQFTQVPENECTYTRAGYAAQILCNNILLGLVGEIHPAVLENYDLKQTAFLFEIYLEHLAPLINDSRQSKPIPKFPAIFRDITIIINNDIETQKVVAEAQNRQEALVERLDLLNVFEGNPIPEGKKSVSLRVTYRSSVKTLKDEDVTPIHQSIADRLVKAFKASLPA